MGENNAYLGETLEHRLARFQQNDPLEVISTLTNSIHSFFNNEIRDTIVEGRPPQTALMILGVHSVALTFSYGFFNLNGEAGYKKFVECFMDGEAEGTKFSLVADRIHEWRNVLAHRWLNVAGHQFGYDYQMMSGYRFDDRGALFINPRIYLDQYLRVFDAGAPIYEPEALLETPEALEDAKQRFISKYVGAA